MNLRAAATHMAARLPWDRTATRRALLLALAAWLAFALASLLHVHNAYWAAMPVWVISQPSRGILLERAGFRVLGTLLGAGVGLGLAHLGFPPLAQIALLALWIALNAAATHVLRGVHGYGALLAGMTAAVVVIPTLLTPAGSLPLALARVDCTLIGVLVGTLVMAFQTPESPLAEFYDQVRAVSAQAVAYAARTLGGEPAEDGQDERRILGQISHLDSMARLHSAGSVAGYRRLGDVDLLVVGSLSAMAAAGAAREAHSRVEPALLVRLGAIAEHLSTAWTQPLAASERRLATGEDPELVRLDRAIGEILAADLALARPDSPRATPGAPGPALAPHREWTLAWREGALAGAASFAALALALTVPMPSVGLAALGICIFVMVLGSLPVPQLIAPKLITGVALGVLTALFYRLVLQPRITSPAGLILSILPFVLAGGLFRTHPRFGAAGIDFSMCFFLASQAGMPATADVPRVLLDSGALLVSAGLMAALFMLLPQRARHQATDAAARIRRDLLRMLDADPAADPARWRARSSRQILRLALHLGRAKDLGRRQPQGLLAALNLGQAVIDLQAQGMPEAVRSLLVATLERRMPPRAAAQALMALVTPETGTGSGSGPVIQNLARTLDQAAELLALDLR